MFTHDKLQENLARIGVFATPAMCDRLIWYLEEMLRWNRSINLTAIKDPEDALEKHLLDSLTLVPLLRDEKNLLDMGSGAGLPSIPVKLVCPALEVLSVDSVQKKVVFQQHVARHFNLTGFEAKACRLQSLAKLGPYVRNFSLVTARAVTHLSNLVSLAEPFLIDGGRILAMKGPEGDKELTEAADVIKAAHLELEGIHRITLPLTGASRRVIQLKRVHA